ncbi:MAG: hypothetical protein B6243_04965 [Anaerolineaceae bacterium 4572_5.2]|nr:MAG: hypothetical protein B6243_04965 [Anaerolineaceae bacterium 4572_5.2]
MIYGENIRLRAIEKEDIPNFVVWLNDPEVRRGLSIFLPLSLTAEEKWLEELQKKSPYEQPLAIEIQPHGEEDEWVFVGNCGLFDLDWRVRQAEVGIHIGEKLYWNQGFGTKAMQLILKHGFETLNLNRLYLRVHADNPRAIRAYEKTGFVKEGVLRQAHFFEGEYVDVWLMSVLRSEWK